MDKQVLIVGGGPAGTACAIELKKRGIASTIIEKDDMPRFHIGESMTGECGASVRKLGFEDIESRMAEDGHPVKWGTIVFGQGGKNSFYIPVMGRDANNELFPQSTWQVRRSSFDKMLFDGAKDLGVNVIKGSALDVIKEGDTITGLKVRVGDEIKELSADIVVDASGQNTFLSRVGVASERIPGNYGKQIGIFGHFRNASRDDGKEHKADDTLIFYRERHHWAWFIPIDKDVVSIGVVVPSEYFKSKKMSMEDFLLSEMPEINSELAWRVEHAELEGEVRGMSNYSYQIKDFTGKGFLCLGDAHRFIDPIFSLGLHFALHEGRMAANAIADEIANPTGAENPYLEFQKTCEGGMDIVQTMLDAFWDYPLAFSLYLKAKKYREGFIDLFAGRVYDGNAFAGVQALEKLNAEGMKQKMAESSQTEVAAV